ncbi:hypothetical protein CKA32_004511 [Geitlerinema sp. FC II]|nr:hypothetical protein CKA32_004511 [Geitlerinema sp. FC II]
MGGRDDSTDEDRIKRERDRAEPSTQRLVGRPGFRLGAKAITDLV